MGGLGQYREVLWIFELLVEGFLGLLDGSSQRLPRRRVRGDAMRPLLRDGQVILPRTCYRDEPKVGQIVVADAGGREVVQRVKADTIDGFVLAGDDRSAGEDAGPVPRERIIGVVDARVARAVASLRRR